MYQCQVLTTTDQKKIKDVVKRANEYPNDERPLAALILTIDLLIVDKVNQAYKFLEASGAVKVCGAKPYVQNKKT